MGQHTILGYRFNLLNHPLVLESPIVVLEKDEDGRVVVRSPDLQGVVTDGADENEALHNALEAVNAILEIRGLPKEYNLTVSHRLSA